MDPKVSKAYAWAVGAAGGLLLFVVALSHPGEYGFLATSSFILFFLLEIALTIGAIPVGKFHVSLDFSIVLATYMIHGFVAACVVNLAVIPALIFRRRPARIIAMDVGALISSTVIAGSFASTLNGHIEKSAAGGFTLAFVREVVLFTVVSYLVNTALIVFYALISARPYENVKSRELIQTSGFNAVCTVLGALLGIVIALNLPKWGNVELYLFSVSLGGLVFLTAILGRMARTHADLARLYEAASAINAVMRLEDVFAKSCDAVSQFIKWDFWWLTLQGADGDARVFKTKTVPGLSEKEALDWLERMQERRKTVDAKARYYWNKERCPSEGSSPFGAALFMPLTRGDRLIGEFGVAKVSSEEIEADTLRLYPLLSAQISLAVDNAMQWERVTELAARDPLTGLYNYREFCSRLAWAIEKAKLSGSKVSLIFIDLDHFRKVNNLYGHMVGDEALKEIADSIRRTVRDSDYACRYGGDEFTIILPSAGKDGARKVAERIMRNIAETRISYRGEPLDLTGVVSASWGVATFPEDGETLEELVNKADLDMYSVKRESKESSEKEQL
ncbi:MAG TPA: GGDEF domain-containing protein [Firmicutes bacterium]|nr:GGDEF domain-containing protein [Candidatus Fermentithermobacillaceae bacterium]